MFDRATSTLETKVIRPEDSTKGWPEMKESILKKKKKKSNANKDISMSTYVLNIPCQAVSGEDSKKPCSSAA